jgi:hypothetical protein
MRSRTTRFLFLAAIAASLATSLPRGARAQGVQYSVQVSVDDALREASVDTPGKKALALEAVAPGVGRATGGAQARIGINKAASTLKGTDPTKPIYTGYSLSTSSWTDLVTISHPRLNGTRGTFTTTMRVATTGSFAVSENWATFPPVDFLAQWRSGIQVFDSQGVFQEAVLTGGWRFDPELLRLTYFGDPLGALEDQVSFSFVYGEPFALGGNLQSHSRVSNLLRTPGAIDSSFDTKAVWGGITALYDANGDPVKKAKLNSASGVNWFEPFDK